MAYFASFVRSKSSSKNLLLCEPVRSIGDSGAEIAAVQDDMDELSVSKKLARSVNQKLKKKKKKKMSAERENGMCSLSGCLGFHVKGSGCRVGACEDLDGNCRRRLGCAEACKPGKTVVENTNVERFSYSMQEKLWRKGLRKEKGTAQNPSISAPAASLPDDILELILSMLPWSSVMAARGVCRRWKYITGRSHFMQMRAEGSYQTPWLLLFGIAKDGRNVGEIHALDISLDRWHRSSHKVLKGRCLFSVVSVQTDVYIVGGCFSSGNSKRTSKEVLVFSPLKGSFHEVFPMKEARSEPVLGVFKASYSHNFFHSQIHLQALTPAKVQAVGCSEVYQDPHRLSLRRQLKDVFADDEKSSPQTMKKPSMFPSQRRKNEPQFALIAVGGHGSYDEPLDSGEIYDPITNKWVEIAKLPVGFGPVCSGVVCEGMFYVYSETDKLAAFDLENGYWVMIQVPRPPLRLPEYYPKLVSCQSRLFMLCVSWCDRDGILNRREKAVRKLWELNLKSHSWSEASTHPDAPMDWNAAFVADQSRIYGVEMFKIFGQVLGFVTACNVSDARMRWNRISKNHGAHEADAASCTSKSALVLHL
ncbi:F-box/kelch-repeat protein [Apostasia shenzhenica]|uniref:F-box/kelch-repeat protein n=1 Tax=Apostasia shenzhenica TaxID=1088818 RepID=A0A2I0AYL2_9ASPA|nr:F-box/kelch-repeat protein [Apostasia shenzhenica]